MQLKELGERKITEEILASVCPAAGDDCCYFNTGEWDLVITTDPVPPPAALMIGGDPDPYWAGRLLVTINASDLAAAAATPLMFTAAIECSPEMEFDDFMRLLNGIKEGCDYEGLSYCGGNLKESKSFAATGTAVGRVKTGKGLHRKGANDGDLIFSVGRGGEFWRDALRWRDGERFPKEQSKLFLPHSQTRAMGILAGSAEISAAMDNSDGLLATLEQLSRVNGLGVDLELKHLSVAGSQGSSTDQARLWLGWGDWNVVIAVPPIEAETLENAAKDNDIELIQIGRFSGSITGVRIIRNGISARAPRLESERFSSDSWFLEGISAYIAMLESLPL